MGFHNVVLHDGYLHRERAKRDDYALVDDYVPWLREQLGQPEADYVDTGVGCNGYAARPWIYDEMLHPTSWVTTQSIDFLRRRDPTKPFFLMMSYHRPHPPSGPAQLLSGALSSQRATRCRSWATGRRMRCRYAAWTARCRLTVTRSNWRGRPTLRRSPLSTTTSTACSWRSTRPMCWTTRPFSSPPTTVRCSTTTT